VDFEFSPFTDNLLATAAEDGHIKLWVLPEQVCQDITEDDGTLVGH
jgi:hypothetical protein